MKARTVRRAILITLAIPVALILYAALLIIGFLGGMAAAVAVNG